MFASRSIASFQPLTNDQLVTRAPSIFAAQAHESRSARYAYIPTARIVDQLRDNGFMPVMAMQSKVRSDNSRKEFAKHMIRFRHVDYANVSLAVGDVFPEVVMVNSHDGSSSYNLMAGLFRLVCGNGMVIASGTMDAVRIHHTGNVAQNVIDGSYRVLDDSRKALDVAGRWQQKILSEREQTALAIGAHHLRFADAAGNVETPIQPAQLLRVRRVDDRANDLWSTFNRVQENVIKGGLHAVATAADGKRRRMSTREVKGIDGNVNLNKALWKLAEHLASSN